MVDGRLRGFRLTAEKKTKLKIKTKNEEIIIISVNIIVKIWFAEWLTLKNFRKMFLFILE